MKSNKVTPKKSNSKDLTNIIPPKATARKKHSSQKKKEVQKGPVHIREYQDYEFHIPLNRLDIYGAQILGSRDTQQDSFSVSGSTDMFSQETPIGWAVVCDGMGGMSSGEVASQTANAVMQQILGSTILDSNIPEVLRQAIFVANEEVKKITAGTSDISGTTLVTIVANGNQLFYASVGDSRIYLCRGNEIAQITRDHNYAMELDEKVLKGEMTEEEALATSQREALISYVGIPELELCDISGEPILMQNEDIVLLCSDGLTKVLPDEEILRLVNANRDNTQKMVDVLLQEVQMACVRKLDNTTIAVVKYQNG